MMAERLFDSIVGWICNTAGRQQKDFFSVFLQMSSLKNRLQSTTVVQKMSGPVTPLLKSYFLGTFFECLSAPWWCLSWLLSIWFMFERLLFCVITKEHCSQDCCGQKKIAVSICGISVCWDGYAGVGYKASCSCAAGGRQMNLNRCMQWANTRLIKY